MANVLFLEELQDTLRYWEDLNFFSENLFQVATASPNTDFTELKYTKPLIGSEVDQFHHLRRSIKGFEEFRKMIKKGIPVADPLSLLPRIPKEKRNVFDKQTDFMRSSLTRYVSFFPYSLIQWLNYKKVFQIDSLGLIEPKSVYEKNYLNLMPYESFIIRLNEPIYLSFKATGVKRGFKTILVNSENGVIDLFFILDNVKLFTMNEETRKFFKNVSLKSKNPRLLKKELEKVTTFDPELRFSGTSVEMSSGNIINYIGRGPEETKWERTFDFSKGELWIITKIDGNFYKENQNEFQNDSEVIDITNFHFNFIEKLNGLCKFISELPNNQTQNLFKGIYSKPVPKQRISEWNAIPVTNVYHLNQDPDVTSKPKIVISRGDEKSPHWRRSHWRVYKNADGSIRQKVWIDQVLIREDKLEKEKLKGNVTVLKDD